MEVGTTPPPGGGVGIGPTPENRPLIGQMVFCPPLGVTSEKSPFLAIVYANRNGIPPGRAQSARAPGPEILNAPRGNPAAKNQYTRTGQNRL